MVLTGGKFPRAKLFTTNHTWTDVGSNMASEVTGLQLAA